MPRPAPSVPTNIDGYRWTPQITGEIIKYRQGKIPFADLYDALSKHDYKAPTHYGQHLDLNELEGVDHHEPGTTGELRQARALNLLSDVEYEAIVSESLRAHGA